MKRAHPSRKLGDFSSRKVCSNKYAVKPNKASITKRDGRIENRNVRGDVSGQFGFIQQIEDNYGRELSAKWPHWILEKFTLIIKCFRWPISIFFPPQLGGNKKEMREIIFFLPPICLSLVLKGFLSRSTFVNLYSLVFMHRIYGSRALLMLVASVYSAHTFAAFQVSSLIKISSVSLDWECPYIIIQ